MDSVDKLEKAVEQMSHEERNRFREWFAEYDAVASLRHRVQLAQQEIAATATQLADSAVPLSSGVGEDSAVAPKSNHPPSIVDEAKWQTQEEWLAAFDRYIASNQGITAVADDSRESIYAGRGE